ncbi:multicopper oxidase domain-containing protein [Nitrosococcus wardiae]|uniref:Twin-arginine translocation signal domain-containing protein n=1 Tax=Nitrosococcus wardiae TaxID=1814290 RepID=A0A4P7C0T2_9GAMM|nr:copper oxidase [Nitrosococcus wardiae]QBQ55160.1 twin-arginine translocation signal domain-containing protein [Nitrosococcus wardiae]
MKKKLSRRQFLATSAAAVAAGALGGKEARGQEAAAAPAPHASNASEPTPSSFSRYSRYHPSFGGPPESDHFLGKLVPGLRKSGLPPVPFEAPDLEKLSWRMVNGVKEFELRCTPVKREFLPGRFMNVWGYNGSLPGPTIEAYQGDRVRFVVHNELPEPTTVHWHGLELPVQFDGVPGLTQNLIPPGETYVYEYDLHQAGTFFYHSHIAMQEAFGMAGFFIIHPRIAYDPPVDRDFGLIFQNFFISPNTATPDSMAMNWNWHTINGRSGPYTTPLVCKHGERVRIRLMDFSPMQHHPIHLHGHTFWLTGTEAGRIPPSAWIPRNTTLTAVAVAQDFEFIAFNPGDWIFHCHMTHHMMNHMTKQVGPRIRQDVDVSRYLAALPNRPPVEGSFETAPFEVPGYPQKMQGMEMSAKVMHKITGRRETRGMRKQWHEGVKGLMTVLRVLPEDLYDRVMHSEEAIQPGEIFEAIARRKHHKATRSAG